jgi:hypothetical protein
MTVPNQPNIRPRRAAGTISRSIATTLGVISPPKSACAIRSTTSAANQGATTASAEAAMKAESPVRKVRRWPRASPILPPSGWASAMTTR